jgi:hypothetical protein
MRHTHSIPPHRHTLKHLIPTPLTHRRHPSAHAHAHTPILPLIPHQEALIETLVGRHTRGTIRRAEHFHTAVHSTHIIRVGCRRVRGCGFHAAIVYGKGDRGRSGDGVEAWLGRCAVREMGGGAGGGGVGGVGSRAAAGLGGYCCWAWVVGAVGGEVHFCVVEGEGCGEVLGLCGCEAGLWGKVGVVAGVDVVVDAVDVGDVEGLVGLGI